MLRGKQLPVPAWRADARGRRAGWLGSLDPPRGALRGPRRRAAPAQGAAPRHDPRTAAAPGLGPGHPGHRQEPARLGAREVRRWARGGHLLAPGSLARVRRWARVLGARARWSAGAPGSPSRTRPMSHAPSSPRWPASTSSMPRSGRGSSPSWPPSSGLVGGSSGSAEELTAGWRTLFERIADQGPDRARVRGPALGGPGPARLHRGSADLRAHTADDGPGPGASGAHRRAPDLRRDGPEPHPARPLAAQRRGDGHAPPRPGAGHPPAGAAGDPGARRGRAALRGRDRSDAARPGTPERVRGQVPAGQRPGRAGRARFAAVAHRCPARHARRRVARSSSASPRSLA